MQINNNTDGQGYPALCRFITLSSMEVSFQICKIFTIDSLIAK